MTLENLKALSEDELLEKIQHLYDLLKIFAPSLLTHFNDPKLSAKLIFLGLRLEECFKDFAQVSKNQQIDKVFEALDLILRFKKQHKSEFEKIFDILQDLLDNYKSNKNDILEAMKEILP